MEAITSQLQAMMLTKPAQNTARGKRQAGRRTSHRKRASKAKYNAHYYKTHNYTINRKRTVDRGNASRRPSLRQATIKKWKIKWDVNARKYY